jgi:hypothetical protein
MGLSTVSGGSGRCCQQSFDAFSSLAAFSSFACREVGRQGAPLRPRQKEYVAGLVISFFVMLVSVEFFRTSLGRVFLRGNSFSHPALALILFSWRSSAMGLYYRPMSKTDQFRALSRPASTTASATMP